MKQESLKPFIIVEVFNALTHGIATLLSIIGLIALLQKGIHLSSPTAIVAYSIYGASLILLFLSSTLYHSFKFSRLRHLFQKFDHSAIYLLIAGTYTPYILLTMRGWPAYTFLALIWFLALSGIIYEVAATDRFPRLSTFLYLLLGWLGVLLIYPLTQNSHLSATIWLGIGGLFYSIGTIFYSMKSKPWMHVIWHLFVIGGAACMYSSILFYI